MSGCIYTNALTEQLGQINYFIKNRSVYVIIASTMLR